MMGRPSARIPTGARRARAGASTGDDDWLTTYADAVTLLLAFFVLLYAMSEVDVQKFAAFLEGLHVPFGNEAGGGLLPASDGLRPDHAPRIGDPGAIHRDTPAPGPDALEGFERFARSQAQLDAVTGALDGALADRGLEELVEQRREERGLVVSIASDDVLFALGSTVIDPVGREVVAVVADVLAGFPNPLVVEGHTDDVPLDRRGYSNWNLSTDRSVAVLSLLVEHHGLPPERVGAAGYGEHRPMASNDTSSGRARNRRVDIVVLVEEPG